jgi:arsenate reductase
LRLCIRRGSTLVIVIERNRKMIQEWGKLLQDSKTKLIAVGIATSDIDRLAERFARERLLAQQQKNGILFLCGHNAGRSQMAEGWFNHKVKLHEKYNPKKPLIGYSAGSNPSNRINPMALQAMQEVGVSLLNSHPKPWTLEVAQNSVAIITMGCGDKCPAIQGTLCRDWKLPDPHGQGIDQVRKVRDQILPLVESLIDEAFDTEMFRVSATSRENADIRESSHIKLDKLL